jgi:galactokinase
MSKQGFEEKTLPFSTYFCPGRVNLIGEHIDYNGGFVLPAAISLGTKLHIRKRDDAVISIQSTNFEGNYLLWPNEPNVYNEQNRWANYAIGCIELLRQKGVVMGGYDMLFDSDLPIGAGLSSSASVEVVTLFALLSEEKNSDYSKEEIAVMAREVENNFIGVSCGIMDQFAVAMGKENHAIKLNCETLEYEYIPADFGEYTLVIINTNKPRSLIHSAYNQRLAECRDALAVINKNHHYTTLCEVPLYVAQTELSGVLLQRATHCITEQARVLIACAALKENNITLFAEQLIGSHESLKTDYEVTGIELDALYNAAVNIDGCAAARMTGAGFGGCAIALVENEKLDGFKSTVAEKYVAATGLNASFHECKIVNGVGLQAQ